MKRGSWRQAVGAHSVLAAFVAGLFVIFNWNPDLRDANPSMASLTMIALVVLGLPWTPGLWVTATSSIWLAPIEGSPGYRLVGPAMLNVALHWLLWWWYSRGGRATPRRLLVAVLVLATLAVAVAVVWEATEPRRRNMASTEFRTALARFAPPDAVRSDPTATACDGYSAPASCLTSAQSAPELLQAIQEEFSEQGVQVDEDQTCEPDPSIMGGTRCTALARRAGTGIMVTAVDGALLPGEPRPRSSAWITHFDDESDEPRDEPTTMTETDLQQLFPPGTRLEEVQRDPDPAVPEPPGTLKRWVHLEAGTGVDGLNNLAERLVAVGFRVAKSCSHRQCPHALSAHRFNSGHQGDVVTVVASATEPKLIVAVTGQQLISLRNRRVTSHHTSIGCRSVGGHLSRINRRRTTRRQRIGYDFLH